MYKENPEFNPPHEEKAKIWRYMNFTEFVSILDRQELFFVRSDKLRDKHEGSVSYFNIKNRHEVKGKGYEKLSDAFPKDIKEFTFINSWHLNLYESAAMWNLYANDKEGIAIQTTYKNLKECFNESPADIFIGVVFYIDYDTERIPEDHTFDPYLYKRKSFEYEKELRAIIQGSPPEKDRDTGLYVKINIDKLIECVYVCPTAPDWIYELTKSVIKKYNCRFRVRKSDLSRDPVY
ncbi:MAG TPA: DUF2971 domain-containing protein [Methanothrix sp.]|nr:DUF2971 domain-containing protein [Methanothrix sp.]HPJ84781.1 DUF2971 domain-containing protein [Methanothrix sp.]HPR66356.1 DUF2971 domain-containing protein [Methanothrix sp.]